jgi:hypothetical protein
MFRDLTSSSVNQEIIQFKTTECMQERMFEHVLSVGHAQRVHFIKVSTPNDRDAHPWETEQSAERSASQTARF